MYPVYPKNNVEWNGIRKTASTSQYITAPIPGPAGRLPKQESTDKSKITNANESTHSLNDMSSCSQPSAGDFQKNLWKQMCSDFKYLPYKYTVTWIKSNAETNKLINQKAPFLAVIIHNIECSNLKSIKMILKDVTGFIPGTIVDNVYKEHHKLLTVGSVIVLKQLGVLITNSNYCLTITGNNLIAIYNEEQDGNVNVTNVQQYFYRDFITTINEIKSKHKACVLKRKSDPSHDNDLQLHHKTLKFDASIVKSCNSNRLYSTPKYNFNTDLPNQHAELFSIKQLQENVLQPSCANQHDLFLNVDSNSRNSSQICIVTENSEDSAVLQNVFEGVDANDLFDDF